MTTLVEYPVYYYGCWDGPGHFLYSPIGRVPRFQTIGPFSLSALDGGPFMPPKTTLSYQTEQDERNVALTWFEGWTVLSMWDRSIDTRFGSHATFVAQGKHLEGAMWALIREHFPLVASRLSLKHPEAVPINASNLNDEPLVRARALLRRALVFVRAHADEHHAGQATMQDIENFLLEE